MAMSFARRWASRAPVRLYAAIGAGAVQQVEALALEPDIERVGSPRHANLLLIAGAVPEQFWPALHRLHDQLPHPRASLYWGTGLPPIDDAVNIDAAEWPAAGLRNLQRDLLLGRRADSPSLLPDAPPASWRGMGEHGQGGEGMMGGKPYGRPLAMTADDLRDGLALDEQHITLGPFAPMLPPGLCLDLTLQGDVIQQAKAISAPWPDDETLEPWREALQAPVPLATLERLRAAHHLQCIARLLRVRGSSALAARFFRAAQQIRTGGNIDAGALARRLRRTGLQQAMAPGLGVVRGNAAGCLQGPALRATGLEADLRSSDAAYRAAGFATLTRTAGDVHARLAQWLAETEQSLALASNFDGQHTTKAETIEAPAGPLGPGSHSEGALDAEAFDTLLQGLEWSQAVSVLTSFDINSLRSLLAEAQA